MIFTLFFLINFFNKSHPQITDSLLAISNFLVFLIINIVGCSPAIPGIADIETSDFAKWNFS